MTNLNHKNNVSSARTSDKKSDAKASSSRNNEKSTAETKKTVLPRNNY